MVVTCVRRRRRRSAFVVIVHYKGELAARMSRARFDLESPIIPTHSTVIPDMTPTATSGWHLWKFENGPKCHIRRLWVEFLQNISREYHEILRIYRDNQVSSNALPLSGGSKGESEPPPPNLAAPSSLSI